MDATDVQLSALAAQWVGSIASLLSVGVAIVFGYLTLANTRRSKDAQERAVLAAATAAVLTSTGSDRTSERSSDRSSVRPSGLGPAWAVTPWGADEWRLVNRGEQPARNVRISGLTELDEKRLTSVGPIPDEVSPDSSVPFTLISKGSLSGPANVVVVFTGDAGDHRAVVVVPAP